MRGNATLRLEALPGLTIHAVVESAKKLADFATIIVAFEFNETEVFVRPGETVKEVVARYLGLRK
jgi:hypothetical protein